MSQHILAIDPGNEYSAYALIDAGTLRPLVFDKIPNNALLHDLRLGARHLLADRIAIEMVTSYGLRVGREVFDTCVWTGIFSEAIHHGYWPRRTPQLTLRPAVKLHHCGRSAAKDADIIQALVDRFTPAQPNHGKGSKTQPGWFHGFRADIWQAYALAVYVADTPQERAETPTTARGGPRPLQPPSGTSKAAQTGAQQRGA